ncbi:hypothetical protein RI129_012697 [Pyrocoelia pectoralis]|uniref:ABC transporter domain-containing protein n=1 Tax=Pyrocoelia pectoralis TaxID=417401 RepID=A0AAN7ZCB3_9COLE
MAVPKGTIYGLLGASGCGKTTLLDCLNGRKWLNSGDIYVLGQKVPETQNETRIGYMPQETALYRDLTVEETFRFFGRIIGMDYSKIRERTEYLVNLLMIPQQHQEVKNMSGGQKRRVSLAVALLHEPELLILDEPTVGADSIVRQQIWSHFLKLTKNGNVTILITTHYIEETLQANTVGFMRAGYLMVEESPKELLRLHQLSTLEEVFLKLSVFQNQNTLERTSKESWTLKSNHMSALILKNFTWMLKNWSTPLIAIIIPIMLISIFCVGIGHNPVNFPISVVNLEVDPEQCHKYPVNCGSEQLSCTFLRNLAQRKLRFYETEHDAISSVQIGESYASLTIKSNYSNALRARVKDWYGVSPYEIELSTIDVFRDLSNKQIAIYTQVMLYETLEEFLYEYLESCGIPQEAVRVPITWDPLYGWMNTDFTDTIAPGFLLSAIFLISIFFTALAMHGEQNGVIVERLLVSGINRIELVVSHIITDSTIVIFQTFLFMLFAFWIFGMTMKGSVLLTSMLLLLTGFSGICFGMFVSCLSTSEIAVTLISVCTTFCTIFTSGIIWPIEGLHWLIKPFSPLLPLTEPTKSLKNILHRNWNLLRPEVFIGFFSITLWALIFLLCSFIVIKIKRL